MNESISSIKHLTLRSGANQEALNNFMTKMGVSLPADYIRFMLTSDGAEGPIGGREYLRLWSSEELQELNDGYGVSEFAPGLVLFGGDGGDVGYAFDSRSRTLPIVKVHFVGMSLESAEPFAENFNEFLDKLARNETKKKEN